MKRLLPLMGLLALVMLALLAPLGQASDVPPGLEQRSTAAATLAPTATRAAAASTATPSTVQIFFVACADRGIVNLSGVMQPGYNVFFQIFNGPGGTGTAITPVIEVAVDGTYAVSQSAAYNAGVTVAAGAGASVVTTIAREGNVSRSVFSIPVNDLQDGCANPQNPVVQGTPVPGTGATGVAGSVAVITQVPQLNSDYGINPATGLQNIPTGVGSGIFSPFGGYLNPTYVQQGQVVIGGRASDIPGRNADAGLIFAECNDFLPAADPGILYDTDQITVFWSWFTRTPEQMQDHLASAQYSVVLNGVIFFDVQRTEPQVINGNYWVFYIARVNNLSAGYYGIEYKVTWADDHFDGYDDYGPGTSNAELTSNCSFRVRQNPQGIALAGNPMYPAWQTPTLGQPAPIRR